VQGTGSSADSSNRAASDAAQAIGLRVDNRIRLRARVVIDIFGSNYAPINVQVLLGSQTDNLGTASAVSGPALATGHPSAAPSAGGDGPQAGQGGSSSTMAHSGNASAVSLQNSVVADNQQLSAVSGPDAPRRLAANASSYRVTSNGVQSAESGPAWTGPILVHPRPQAGRSGAPAGAMTSASGRRDVGGSGDHGTTQTITAAVVAGGGRATSASGADVPLWFVPPDPGIPPLPDQAAERSVYRPAVRNALAIVAAAKPVEPGLPLASARTTTLAQAPARPAAPPSVAAHARIPEAATPIASSEAPRPVARVAPASAAATAVAPRSAAVRQPATAQDPAAPARPGLFLVIATSIVVALLIGSCWSRRGWLMRLGRRAGAGISGKGAMP
jgi:hypothetical protein